MDWNLVAVIIAWMVFVWSVVNIVGGLIMWNFVFKPIDRVMGTLNLTNQYILATLSSIVLYVNYLT